MIHSKDRKKCKEIIIFTFQVYCWLWYWYDICEMICMCYKMENEKIVILWETQKFMIFLTMYFLTRV